MLLVEQAKYLSTIFCLPKFVSNKELLWLLLLSGIAATLLPSGRIAHSAFKLPFDYTINEHPVCNINKIAGTAQILKRYQIIVWNEYKVAHKETWTTIGRTLQDINDCPRPMGGVAVVWSGDFRQNLPSSQKEPGQMSFEPVWDLLICVTRLWEDFDKTLSLSPRSMKANFFGEQSEQYSPTVQLEEIKFPLHHSISLSPTSQS